MILTITAPSAYIIAHEWMAKSASLEAAGDRIVGHHAQLLLTQIQSHASGRPGPNAPTGDYRRSWSINTPHNGSREVGTNRPQGRRLENGFVGADSLGRVYNQPPFPHVEPAVGVVFPMMTNAFEVLVASL